VIYILHGDDEFGLSEELAGLRVEHAGSDEAMAQLNTSVLDGERLTMGELRHACDSMPFMAEWRLVIVKGMLSRLSARGKTRGQQDADEEEPSPNQALLDDLAAYLPDVPSSTCLILVEPKALRPSHPILKLVQAQEKLGRAKILSDSLPKDKELTGWIHRRVRSKGGDFSGQAIILLDRLVGKDLRLLDQEIDKLMLYAGERQVTADDVRSLVSLAREASIFDLVDCVGRREADKALRLLHRMLDEGAEPLYLLAMLARQVRILIQVSELQAQRLAQKQVASQLSLHPYVVEKGVGQARNFTMAQLVAAHEQIVQTDWMIKTGQWEPVVALDMLVVTLTRA
jgi:DNA polymerase-3 subunit delta